MNRNQLISIHIAKKEAGLDDAAYRDMLFRTVGVRSAKDIASYEQYEKVMKAMRPAFNPRAIKFKPKAVHFNFENIAFSKPHEPWQYFDATADQWENMCGMIDKMAKVNITLVAVWEADGRRRFKYRPMVKGRDY